MPTSHPASHCGKRAEVRSVGQRACARPLREICPESGRDPLGPCPEQDLPVLANEAEGGKPPICPIRHTRFSRIPNQSHRSFNMKTSGFRLALWVATLPVVVVPFLEFVYGISPLDTVRKAEYIGAPFFLGIPLVYCMVRKLGGRHLTLAERLVAISLASLSAAVFCMFGMILVLGFTLAGTGSRFHPRLAFGFLSCAVTQERVVGYSGGGAIRTTPTALHSAPCALRLRAMHSLG